MRFSYGAIASVLRCTLTSLITTVFMYLFKHYNPILSALTYGFFNHFIESFYHITT